MDFTFTFINIFARAIALMSPLLGFLLFLLLLLSYFVGRLEKWTLFDSIYWGFITALTVGYGDIKPSKKSARVLAIWITFIGLIFSGMIVALSLEAATRAFQQHENARQLSTD